MAGVGQEYIGRVLREVKFTPDHDEIKRELAEHIEDLLEFGPEMSVEEAKNYVLENMGDPSEVGKALNKEHHEGWGWAWLATRFVLMCLVLTIGLPFIWNFCYGAYLAVQGVVEGYPKVRRLEVVETIDINKKVTLDYTTVYFDELVLFENDTYALRYWNYGKGGESVMGFSLEPWIYTDKGERIKGRYDSDYRGWYVQNQIVLDEIEDDIEKIVIDYEYYGRVIYVKIPLNRR